jgi:hypothetical protein
MRSSPQARGWRGGGAGQHERGRVSPMKSVNGEAEETTARRCLVDDGSAPVVDSGDGEVLQLEGGERGEGGWPIDEDSRGRLELTEGGGALVTGADKWSRGSVMELVQDPKVEEGGAEKKRDGGGDQSSL